MEHVASVFKGVVRGRTIELNRDINLPDGQQVEVNIHPIDQKTHVAGDGIRESAGGWSDDPRGLDDFIKWTYEQRRLTDRPEITD